MSSLNRHNQPQRTNILLVEKRPLVAAGFLALSRESGKMRTAWIREFGKVRNFFRDQDYPRLIVIGVPTASESSTEKGVAAFEKVRAEFPFIPVVALMDIIKASDVQKMRSVGIYHVIHLGEQRRCIMSTLKLAASNSSISAESQCRYEERAVSLSEREEEVVALLAKGLTNKEIAYTLDISPETVKNHVSNALEKECATSRYDLIAKLSLRNDPPFHD